MGYNISPETIIKNDNGDPVVLPVDLNSLIYKKQDTSFAKQHDYSMAATGVCFKRDKQGLLPFLVDGLYADRKATKKRMLHYKSQHEMIVEELRQRGIKVWFDWFARTNVIRLSNCVVHTVIVVYDDVSDQTNVEYIIKQLELTT